VADLLVNQVGITVNQPQGQATVTPQRFQMRGFTDTKKVLLLMDGQPMNSGWTDYFYFSQLPLEAVERIEIVRGPFSSLYGTNAMGGVINIITRNGWDKKFKASGLYEDGEFGETEAIATVEGTPAEGKVSAFLSYSDYTIDNYYKFENKEKLLEADSDLNTLADVDEDLANRDYEHQRFHGSVRIKASDDLAFDISGGRMDSESGYGMGTNLGNRNQRDIDRYYLNGRGSLKLTPELDLFFGVQYLDEDITYSGETLTTINYITVGPPANPTYIPTSFDVEQTESKSGFDTTRAFLGGNWQISNTNVLTLGGEFVWNKGYSRVVRAGTDDVVDVLGRSGERVDVSEELGSLYGQDEWRFFDDQLALVFGLRYDDYDFLDGEWSPRGAATWHYNESGRVKASVGKAFHAPSMNDRKTNPWTLSVPKSPWQPAVTRIPNPDLQP
jgi:outer membrane receptor for ferrienterochelin and colicin